MAASFAKSPMRTDGPTHTCARAATVIHEETAIHEATIHEATCPLSGPANPETR
jgi:hypothetical protein